MAAMSTRTTPIFQAGDFDYLSTKGLHIRSQECKHLRDLKLGPYKVVSRVGISTLIDFCYLRDIDYTICFIAICCLMRLRPPLFDLTKQRLKVITTNMQLNLSWMSKLIIA